MLGTTELGPESVPACAAPLLPPPRPPTNPSVTPIPRPGARVLAIFLTSFHSDLCARISYMFPFTDISLFSHNRIVITQQTFAGTDLNVSYSALQERIHCVARLHPHYGWCPMNRSAQSDGIAKIIMAHMR